MNIDRQKIYQVDDYKFVNFVMLDEETSENIRIWRNHPDIRKRMYSEDEIPRESHHKFVHSLNDCDTKFYWLVYKGDNPVGAINLVDVEKENNRAMFGYYLFPQYLSNGIGLEFLYAVNYFYFRDVQVESVYGETAVENRDALISCACIGYNIDFTPIFINGKYFYRISCNSDDFLKAYEQRNDSDRFIKLAHEYRRLIKQKSALINDATQIN